MISYDMDSVGSYDEMAAELKANDPQGWPDWEHEYVSGKGKWAVGGEMDIKRFPVKQDAYAEFLERMTGHEFLDFFKNVGRDGLEELLEGLDQTKYVVLLKWVFGDQSSDT